MNAHQMESNRDHPTYDEDPHMKTNDSGPGGVHIGHNEEHIGEKQSVLKKVKAKARKIKNSIKEHVGHGHDDHDDEEDDDEMDTDPQPEIHGTYTTQSFMPGKEGVGRQHESKWGGSPAFEGSPRASRAGGDYQTFDPTTARYTPGQDETTLGWSRTDTGSPKESDELPNAPRNTPADVMHIGGGHSTGGLERGNKGDVDEDPQTPKDVWEDQHPANYQAEVTDPTCIGIDSAAAHDYLAVTHRSNQGERTAMEGVTHASLNKPQGDDQTFDANTASYVLGQEANLDWPSPDTRMPRREDEVSDAAEDTLFAAHSGGEEMGVTPVLHRLDRMHIHEEPQQKQNISSSQEESISKPKHSPQDKISTGSHDQFFPEPITSGTSTFLQTPESGSHQLGEQGWHDKSEQKQGSYAGKISSAAAMVADKAKQATSSVTSKLGYGDSSDQPSTAFPRLHDKSSEPGGYGETVSNVTTTIADKAVQAKDVVATKLGYGGTHEEQPVVKESKGGSTMASKVQGSGTEHDVGPTTTTEATRGSDKGVSMKEYLVDKLRPGEDDKALSEVITGSLPLHKRKEDVSKVGEEGQEKKVTIKGKVTEPNEVARQFVMGEETNYDDAGTELASPGKGVMDRILEATNFWYQKSGVSPAKDIPEGKEGSSSIVSSEEDGQYEVNKATLNM